MIIKRSGREGRMAMTKEVKSKSGNDRKRKKSSPAMTEGEGANDDG